MWSPCQKDGTEQIEKIHLADPKLGNDAVEAQKQYKNINYTVITRHAKVNLFTTERLAVSKCICDNPSPTNTITPPHPQVCSVNMFKM